MVKTKKRIILFCVFFVIVIFILSMAMFYISGRNEKYVEKFVDNYLKNTTPEKFASHPILAQIKVSRFLSANCKIRIQKDDCQPNDISIVQYLRGISKLNFMQTVYRCILIPPVFETSQNQIKATFVEGYLEDNYAEISNTTLIIKKSMGRYRIKEVIQVYRKPSQNELEQITKDSLPLKNYDAKKGLGARYLGGGHFIANVSISPDGSKLVYASLRHESSELYLINVDGTGECRLTNTPYWEILPSFMPDGNNVFFLSDQENYQGEPYQLNIITGETKKAAPDFYGIKNIITNKQQYAFTASSIKGMDIYLKDIVSSNAQQLTQNGLEKFTIVFSREGEKLYFSQKWYEYDKQPPLTVELFCVDIYGHNIRQLTDNRYYKSIAGYTSDKRLFFILQNEDYKNELWVLNESDSTKHHIITGINGLDSTSLMPDESAFLFVDDRVEPYKYDVYSVTTREPYEIKRVTSLGCYISHPSISSDGKFIALVAETADSPKNGKGKIMLVDILSGQMRFVGNNY